MFDLTNVDLETKLKDTSIWTIVSFFVILTGYISYFAYCVINNIPYSTPSLYLIVGLGLMNLLYWVSLYISTENGNDWDSLKILMVIFYFTYFTKSPIIFMYILGFYLIIRADGIRRIIKFNKIKDAELTSDVEPSQLFYDKWDPKTKKDINLLMHLIIIILTMLYGGISTTLYIISYYLMYELVYIFTKPKILPYQIVIVVILVPCLLTKNFLNKTNFSIFGLSKSLVDITYLNGNSERNVLVFQDANYLFIKKNIDDDSTIAISNKNILRYYISGEIKYPQLKGILNSNKSSKIEKNINNPIDSCQ